MTGNRLFYADLLSRTHLGALYRAVKIDFPHDVSAALLELRHWGLAPVLPAALLSGLRRLRHGPAQDAYPPWLTTAFTQQAAIKDRLRAAQHQLETIPTLYQREYYRHVIGAEMAYSLEANDRCAAHAGTQLVHPFLDRSLLEFCFQIPPQQWLRGFESKHLLRRAMLGLLPDRIRLRQDKAEFSSMVIAALRLLPPDLWRPSSQLVQLGVLELEPLRAAVGAFTTSSGTSLPFHLLGPLWEACSLEWWLRVEFGS